MPRFFFFFFFFPLFLFSFTDPFEFIDEDPSVFHHVNVITGHLNLAIEDTIVQGAYPYPIMRSYSSEGALENLLYKDYKGLKKFLSFNLMKEGWELFSNTFLLFERTTQKSHIIIKEKNGSLVEYIHKENNKYYPNCSNTSSYNKLSARNNNKNNVLFLNEKQCYLTLADGSCRYYERFQGYPYLGCVIYRLSKEVLPSKLQIHYEYDENNSQLKYILIKNPSGNKTLSWIHIDKHHLKKTVNFSIKTSDGKNLYYSDMIHCDKHYLYEVRGNCKSQEKLDYIPGRKNTGARLESLSWENQTQLKVHYYMPPNIDLERLWAKKPEKKIFL